MKDMGKLLIDDNPFERSPHVVSIKQSDSFYVVFLLSQHISAII